MHGPFEPGTVQSDDEGGIYSSDAIRKPGGPSSERMTAICFRVDSMYHAPCHAGCKDHPKDMPSYLEGR